MELTFQSFKEFNKGTMFKGESLRNVLLSDKIEKTIKVNAIKIFYPKYLFVKDDLEIIIITDASINLFKINSALDIITAKSISRDKIKSINLKTKTQGYYDIELTIELEDSQIILNGKNDAHEGYYEEFNKKTTRYI